MPTPTKVKLDQSKNPTLVYRKGEGRALTLEFLESAAAFNLTPYTFLFQVTEIDSDTVLFGLTQGSGLTNGGAAGNLVIDPSDDDVDLDEKTYEYKLKISAPANETWFNGQFVINNSPQEDTDSDSATINLDIGNVTLQVTITMNGAFGNSNIDGGSASTVYLADQSIDGGDA